MNRLVWLLLVLTICLPVAVLATGVRVPGLDRAVGPARPAAVPEGDREMAWFHTSTAGPTWERFVSGLVRARLAVPGLRVDDAGAFNESTTGVPEVVLSRDGFAGSLRVRWYKVTNDATPGQWVEALARRGSPPLAAVGGGSTDRAVDLARALKAQEEWPGGARPLFFITTATATEYTPDGGGEAVKLIDLYDDRTFRFCFNNKQMAEAVVDFAWGTPGLHPGSLSSLVPGAAGGGPALAVAPRVPRGLPRVLSVKWLDDPYSVDLHDRFDAALALKATLIPRSVAFSVGGQATPNAPEAVAAASIAEYLRDRPDERTVLVLPTVTNPARRLLRAIAESDPGLRDRLVVATGDGIPGNALTRDGAFAWPIRAVPVPLVLFAHHDPAGWDARGQAPLPGYELRPPNATEDVLHFAWMGQHLAEACFCPGGTEVVADADELARRMHSRPTPSCPKPCFPTPLFDAEGERLDGTGEYVALVKPLMPMPGEAEPPDAVMEVYRREPDRRWKRVRAVPIDQARGRPGANDE